MNTENIPYFDILSPEGKVKYFEKEYKKNLYCLFACACFLFIVMIYLGSYLFRSVAFPTNVFGITALGIIFVTLQWLITIRSYNRALKVAQSADLTPNIKLPVNSYLPIFCSGGLSLMLMLEMIWITFFITLYQSDLMLIAYGTTVLGVICFVVNILSINEIKEIF